MPEFEVAYRFAHPARAVWNYVSWTGVERLVIPGLFAGTTFEDRTALPHALRYVQLADGSRAVEELVVHDERRRHYEYRLADAGAFPVRNLRGFVTVEETSEESCVLRLGHDCEPQGMERDEWRNQWLQGENAVADFIARALSR